MLGELFPIVTRTQGDGFTPCKAAGTCRCGVSRRGSTGRARDVVLSLLGLLGWLALPKCPMCLGVYISMATGIGLSFTLNHTLYYALGAIALAAMFLGVIRLISAFKPSAPPT